MHLLEVGKEKVLISYLVNKNFYLTNVKIKRNIAISKHYTTNKIKKAQNEQNLSKFDRSLVVNLKLIS